ncbi:MAG: DUF3127 domain-containing protein [Cyclobacteriaceae bacterium]|nr:DUF3127 domain-containing protein [Cyclobacteriaceae bacterium]
MEIKGKIVELSDLQQVTDTFQKREFVVEYAENPSYPEFLKFETIQDRCSILSNVKVNDEVMVSFNLKGRKWTDRNGEVKYFNSLQAWRLTPAENGVAQNQDQASEVPEWVQQAPENTEEDQLPF